MELAQAGYEVYGLIHKDKGEKSPHVVQSFCCDLTDATSLKKVVSEAAPDVVVHLAAISFVAHGDVAAIYQANVVGSRNLLEALAGLARPPKAVLFASSANVYGNATGGSISEEAVLSPENDYAVSKLSMEYVARLYRHKLPLIITRPFNYTGVGQAGHFLLPKIVDHIRRRAPVIELGNLDVSRDFSDVQTVVRCYHLLLENEQALGQVFNICSGQPYSLQDVLGIVREISAHDFEVRVNPAFVRQNEVKVLVGNRQKLESVIGPVKDVPLQETLSRMIRAD